MSPPVREADLATLHHGAATSKLARSSVTGLVVGLHQFDQLRQPSYHRGADVQRQLRVNRPEINARLHRRAGARRRNRVPAGAVLLPRLTNRWSAFARTRIHNQVNWPICRQRPDSRVLSGWQLVSTIPAPAKGNVPTTSATNVGVAQRVQLPSRESTTTAAASIQTVGHSDAARDSTICA